MNWLEQLKNASLIEPLGWALLHSLWQGTAIAVVAALLLRLARSRSAQLRYGIACLALFTMLIAAIGTFIELSPRRIPAISGSPIHLLAPTIQPARFSEPIPRITPIAPSMTDRIRPILPSLALAWIAGVFLLGAYHVGGWMLLRRLRIQSRTIADVSSRAMLTDLIAAMHIHRTVQLCESVLVQVPTVIGWLSPIILLPASAVIGLSPSELRGLLAHELAHIRRHDYVVNLLQTVIETLLFYHPATWWLGKVIRQERENCCDDLAAAVCDRTIYAQALATMESLRQSPQLALSAKGSALLPRIRRILGMPTIPNRRPLSSGIVSASILVAVVAGGILLNACRSNVTPTSKSTTSSTPAETQMKPGEPIDRVSIHSGDTNFEVTSRQIWSSVPNEDDVKSSTRPASETGTFSISGMVGRPGQLMTSAGDFRLLDAIAKAQGATPSAKSVAICRGDSNRMRIIFVSLDELHRHPEAFNVTIFPKDSIYVGAFVPPMGPTHASTQQADSAPMTLQGRITEAATGKPVPNVTVRIYGGFATRWLTGSTTTDADGRYHFDHPSGSLIESKSAGHWDVYIGMQIDHPNLCSADGESWWDVTIPYDSKSFTRDFKLVPGGKLIGTVNNQLGEGEPNLELAISSKDKRFFVYATTGSNGQFVTPTLFPGNDYSIVVNDPKLKYPQLATAQVRAGQTSPIELHFDPPSTTQATSGGSGDLSHVQIDQVNAQIDAANEQMQKAMSEISADDAQVAEMQKMMAQRQKMLADLSAEIARRNSNSSSENNPASQPTDDSEKVYYISGVERSGVYSFGRRKVTLYQAIVASGMNDSMRSKTLNVVHKDGSHHNYKMSDILDGDQGKTLAQADDVLMVMDHPLVTDQQPTKEYYVAGKVPRVGVYSIGKDVNLLQAIIAAGADPSKMPDEPVQLRHRLSDDHMQIEDFTMRQLMQDPSKVILQPDDVVMVGQRPISRATTRP